MIDAHIGSIRKDNWITLDTFLRQDGWRNYLYFQRPEKGDDLTHRFTTFGYTEGTWKFIGIKRPATEASMRFGDIMGWYTWQVLNTLGHDMTSTTTIRKPSITRLLQRFWFSADATTYPYAYYGEDIKSDRAIVRPLSHSHRKRVERFCRIDSQPSWVPKCTVYLETRYSLTDREQNKRHMSEVEGALAEVVIDTSRVKHLLSAK